MTDQERDRFARIFRLNVERRSRTAKGKDEGSKTSSKKKPLLLQGDELKAQVAKNVEDLITDVLKDAGSKAYLGDGDLRRRCERWFDIANKGLYGPGTYADEYAQIEVDAERLGRALGYVLQTNPRYRLWTPMYTTAQVASVMLEPLMDEFYGMWEERLSEIREMREIHVEPHPADLAQMMSYVDVMMDGELHPWMDGCGRVCTAAVMWIAAVHGSTPPLFAPTKDEHYKDIRDLDKQAEYFLQCFGRADVECP